MREQLNSNPLMQLAVVGMLVIGAGFFLLSSSGGRPEEGESGATETTEISVESGATPGTTTTGTGTAEVPALPAEAALDAPPPPPAVSHAYESNKTIVLLFVRNGGIDDRLVKNATAEVDGLGDVALFVVPARKISRYASIAEGVGVDRVPALVVVRPKRFEKTVPTASVSYGFQRSQSVVQAIVDAGYKGPNLNYHP